MPLVCFSHVPRVGSRRLRWTCGCCAFLLLLCAAVVVGYEEEEDDDALPNCMGSILVAAPSPADAAAV